MLGVGAGFVAVGSSVGVRVGLRVFVGVGVRVGVGVCVGVGVFVGVGVLVGVGVFVGVKVAVGGMGVSEGRGVKVAVGGTKMGPSVFVGATVPISSSLKDLSGGTGSFSPPKAYSSTLAESISPA